MRVCYTFDVEVVDLRRSNRFSGAGGCVVMVFASLGRDAVPCDSRPRSDVTPTGECVRCRCNRSVVYCNGNRIVKVLFVFAGHGIHGWTSDGLLHGETRSLSHSISSVRVSAPVASKLSCDLNPDGIYPRSAVSFA